MSLALVGQAALSERIGRNARFASIGNGLAAGLMGIAGSYVPAVSMFLVSAVLVVPALLSLFLIGRGRVQATAPNKPPMDGDVQDNTRTTWQGVKSVFLDRKLAIFAACVVLFFAASAAIGPGVAAQVTRRQPDIAALRSTSRLPRHVLPRRPILRTTSVSVPTELRGHSAHIGPEVEVHYRWHALHGRKVCQLYAERRSGREVAIVEAEPGVAIVLAAWILDPAVCGTMSFGRPTVDIAGLADLDRLLKAVGLRRPCSDETPLPKEVHRAITVASDCLLQASQSARDIAGPSRVERDDTHRPQHRNEVSCPPADGSRRRRSEEIGDDER